MIRFAISLGRVAGQAACVAKQVRRTYPVRGGGERGDTCGFVGAVDEEKGQARKEACDWQVLQRFLRYHRRPRRQCPADDEDVHLGDNAGTEGQGHARALTGGNLWLLVGARTSKTVRLLCKPHAPGSDG